MFPIYCLCLFKTVLSKFKLSVLEIKHCEENLTYVRNGFLESALESWQTFPPEAGWTINVSIVYSNGMAFSGQNGHF